MSKTYKDAEYWRTLQQAHDWPRPRGGTPLYEPDMRRLCVAYNVSVTQYEHDMATTLSEFIVLNPTWVCGGFAGLLAEYAAEQLAQCSVSA